MSEMPREFEWQRFNQAFLIELGKNPIIQTAGLIVRIAMVASGTTCLISLAVLTL